MTINSSNDINVSGSNITTAGELSMLTGNNLNINSSQNITQSILIHEENTPNYTGYAVRGAIDGAVNGFFAAKTGGANGENKGDFYADKVGLGGVNGFLSNWSFGTVGVVKTPVSKLVGFGSDKLVDSTIGLEDIDKSESSSVLTEEVKSKIDVGGEKIINILT